MLLKIIKYKVNMKNKKKELGKPTDIDLKQGHITLPVFYAMKDPLFKEKVEHLFRDTENINQNELTEVINYLKQTDAIEQSYNLSNRYLNKALNSLEYLPNNKFKKTLQVIAKVICKRK